MNKNRWQCQRFFYGEFKLPLLAKLALRLIGTNLGLFFSNREVGVVWKYRGISTVTAVVNY
jgi:hypothetical protein